MEIPARLDVSGPTILSHFWSFVNSQNAQK